MAKWKVKMNSAGAREVMNSEGVEEYLLFMAKAMKYRAENMGSGEYEADVQLGVNRAHARVKTTDILSIASNAKHNSLLKALKG